MPQDELFQVAGQVVLVSGGTRGIGRALAEGFALRDAKVWITGRQSEAAESAAAGIKTSRYPVRGLGCDVEDGDQIRSAVKTVVSTDGTIDTLLNVAGVNRRQRVETYTDADYDFIVNTNQRGSFLMAQAVGREMLAAKRGGSIINVGSLNTHGPLKAVVPYAMSKNAVVGMTKGLAVEWGPVGIRVNCLDPGFILTDLTQKLWSDPTMQEWGQRNTPLGRLGKPDDLIGAAIFLASPAAKFVTGQQLFVDGGFTAGYAWPIPLD
jgi:NAD(P)-dependent dehydrogenase (short-subunit alcohol dehydrogenase family)